METAQSWHELTSEEDVRSFMDLVGDFHDGCIREIHVESGHHVLKDLSMNVGGKTTVHLLVQRQFPGPSAVELRFDDVIRLAVNPPPPNYDAIIYKASFFLREQVFHWAESNVWEADAQTRDEYTWVASGGAWWRDASDWMGADLRYRTGYPRAVDADLERGRLS